MTLGVWYIANVYWVRGLLIYWMFVIVTLVGDRLPLWVTWVPWVSELWISSLLIFVCPLPQWPYYLSMLWFPVWGNICLCLSTECIRNSSMSACCFSDQSLTGSIQTKLSITYKSNKPFPYTSCFGPVFYYNREANWAAAGNLCLLMYGTKSRS